MFLRYYFDQGGYVFDDVCFLYQCLQNTYGPKSYGWILMTWKC